MMANSRIEPSAASALQFISFTVGLQTFAVDIVAVREIRRWSDTTPLPHVPEFVRGVINLRGVIVPIYDLKARFGRGQTEPTRTHVVIIVAVAGRMVGLLVDAVLDILSIQPEQLLAVPEIENTPETVFLRGIVTVEDRMIAVLGLDLLFDYDAVMESAVAALESQPTISV
jgi:purine-binding chemotaxis protein CheW